MQICHLIFEKHNFHFYFVVSGLKHVCYERITLVLGLDPPEELPHLDSALAGDYITGSPVSHSSYLQRDQGLLLRSQKDTGATPPASLLPKERWWVWEKAVSRCGSALLFMCPVLRTLQVLALP